MQDLIYIIILTNTQEAFIIPIYRRGRASLVAHLLKKPPVIRTPQLNSWFTKFPWRKDRLPTPVFLGFPGGSVSKESTCNVGDLRSIPVLGRSPGGGHGNPLQYSYLENPQGQKSLMGCSSWGRKEWDKNEWLSTAQYIDGGMVVKGY